MNIDQRLIPFSPEGADRLQEAILYGDPATRAPGPVPELPEEAAEPAGLWRKTREHQAFMRQMDSERRHRANRIRKRNKRDKARRRMRKFNRRRG